MKIFTRGEWDHGAAYHMNGFLLLLVIALCLVHAYVAISRLQMDEERAEIDNAVRVFEAIQQIPKPSPTPVYQNT